VETELKLTSLGKTRSKRPLELATSVGRVRMRFKKESKTEKKAQHFHSMC
jgi:hypothetical protein